MLWIAVPGPEAWNDGACRGPCGARRRNVGIGRLLPLFREIPRFPARSRVASLAELNARSTSEASTCGRSVAQRPKGIKNALAARALVAKKHSFATETRVPSVAAKGRAAPLNGHSVAGPDRATRTPHRCCAAARPSPRTHWRECAPVHATYISSPQARQRGYDRAFATRPVRRDREAGEPGTHDAEGATRPETLRQNNGKVSRTLESDPVHCTRIHRRGAARRRLCLISQVTGQRGDRRRPVAPIFLGARTVRCCRHRRSG